MNPPLRELEAAELLLQAEALALEDLARLFTVAEFRAAFDELAGQRGPKEELLQAVAQLGLDRSQLLARLAQGTPVVAPLQVDTVQLLQLLFFGNRHQDLTEFVLSDLGVSRYYPYPLDREQRLFRDREAVEEYLAWSALGDRYWELRELQGWDELVELAQLLQDLEVSHAPSRRRYRRLLNSLARDLERLQELDLAELLYLKADSHPARERRARILEAREDWAGALQLCREIERDPWCEAERDAARRMAPRMQRKLQDRPVPRPRERFDTRDLAIPRGEESVERLAAAALAPDWRRVDYVENALMNGLFGLAYWEQIFAPVDGVFHNPYQSAPADMYDTAFREARTDLLDRRSAELAATDLAAELLAAWDRYHPYQCRWLNPRVLDRDLIAAALQVIPPQHLLAVWQRMLFDPGENRRGFPDLIAIGEAPGDYCLVEVKGPGDNLQDSQKRWLRFFEASSIPASVLRVQWADD